MEDGLLAVIFALGGLGRLTFGDALSGDPRPSWEASAAQVRFQDEAIGAEIAAARSFGGGALAPVLGASVTEDGAAWAGAGLRWTLGTDRLWLESTFMPGLHLQGDGPDLGSPLQFRSSLGVVYAFDEGSTLAVTVDHRSNGDFASVNPGLETVAVRWTWPID